LYFHVGEKDSKYGRQAGASSEDMGTITEKRKAQFSSASRRKPDITHNITKI